MGFGKRRLLRITKIPIERMINYKKCRHVITPHSEIYAEKENIFIAIKTGTRFLFYTLS